MKIEHQGLPEPDPEPDRKVPTLGRAETGNVKSFTPCFTHYIAQHCPLALLPFARQQRSSGSLANGASSLICVWRRRHRRGVADGSRQLALGAAERSFSTVFAMTGEASLMIGGRRRAATETSRPPSSPATAEAANL